MPLPLVLVGLWWILLTAAIFKVSFLAIPSIVAGLSSLFLPEPSWTCGLHQPAHLGTTTRSFLFVYGDD